MRATGNDGTTLSNDVSTSATTASESTPPIGPDDDNDEESNNDMDQIDDMPLISEEQEKAGWDERVGNKIGLWICVPKQKLYIVEAGKVSLSMSCATATTGVGARVNTNQTPPGWHRIVEKIGEKEPKGRIFRSRGPTNGIWHPGDETQEDLVLTRIFILDGLEPGVNRGKDKEGNVVDSRQRYIYIHGTNDEERLGEPSSKGCIRVSNNDAMLLFEKVPIGTLIYIQP
jgi:hypothetical protein